MEEKVSEFMKPKELTKELEAIVGKGPMPRTNVTKKIWAYIKKHNLQDPKNLRMIIPDEKLSVLFGSKKPINMFKMTQLFSKHIRKCI